MSAGSYAATEHAGGANGTGDGPIRGPKTYVDRALPKDDASLADLVSRLVADASLLLRQEVELAKTELRRDLTAAGKASVLLVAGGLLAFVALLLVAFTAAWGLATVLPVWAGFLIVALIIGAAAAALIMTGKKKIEAVDLTPHQSIASMKRDKEVLSERTPR